MKVDQILKFFKREVSDLIRNAPANYKEANKKIFEILSNAKIFRISNEILDKVWSQMDVEGLVDRWNINQAEEKLLEFDILQLRLPARRTLVLWEKPYTTKSTLGGYVLGVEFIGMLISHEGLFSLMWLNKGGKKIPHVQITYYKDKWVPYMGTEKDYPVAIIHAHQRMMEACVALSVINTISSVEIAGSTRKKGNGVIKYSSDLPEAYYEVRLRDEIRTDKDSIDKIIKTIIRKGYSYFVRAHRKHRVHYGWSPIGQIEFDRLRRDPRRRIYKNVDEMGAHDKEYLERRGFRIQPGMWVAVLEFDVREHYARTEFPYVPATHVVK